jgi:hypothetical protein
MCLGDVRKTGNRIVIEFSEILFSASRPDYRAETTEIQLAANVRFDRRIPPGRRPTPL